MAEAAIKRLFEAKGLGEVLLPVTPVSGGFLHRMYRVRILNRTYAVKCLNPEIMKRPDAMDNYRRAEELEKILEDGGIPIVPALEIEGQRMQELDGRYYYIFRWQEGRITDWDRITEEQCRQAGNIQGRIHALRPGRATGRKQEMSRINWKSYIREAEGRNGGIAALLRENETLLTRAQDEMNRARTALPDIECITDEDMDPKNVMWDQGRPVVIDLECLGYGNPVSHALQLSLQWAGVTTCSLDTEKMNAFFDGYLEAYDNGFRDYGSVLGIAYTWIEWLEFNLRRALGQCQDGAEQETGENQARETVRRIRHIRENEDRIRQAFSRRWPG